MKMLKTKFLVALAVATLGFVGTASAQTTNTAGNNNNVAVIDLTALINDSFNNIDNSVENVDNSVDISNSFNTTNIGVGNNNFGDIDIGPAVTAVAVQASATAIDVNQVATSGANGASEATSAATNLAGGNVVDVTSSLTTGVQVAALAVDVNQFADAYGTATGCGGSCYQVVDVSATNVSALNSVTLDLPGNVGSITQAAATALDVNQIGNSYALGGAVNSAATNVAGLNAITIK